MLTCFCFPLIFKFFFFVFYKFFNKVQLFRVPTEPFVWSLTVRDHPHVDTTWASNRHPKIHLASLKKQNAASAGNDLRVWIMYNWREHTWTAWRVRRYEFAYWEMHAVKLLILKKVTNSHILVSHCISKAVQLETSGDGSAVVLSSNRETEPNQQVRPVARAPTV